MGTSADIIIISTVGYSPRNRRCGAIEGKIIITIHIIALRINGRRQAERDNRCRGECQ